MNLVRIAFRIAFEEQVGADPAVVKIITDDLKAQFDIDPNQEPYEQGANSAVYDNKNGHVVVFSMSPDIRNIAERAMRKNVDVLPKVYRVDQFNIEELGVDELASPTIKKRGTLYAIELEKLDRILDNSEVWLYSMYNDAKRRGVDLIEYAESVKGIYGDEMIIFFKAMMDLDKRAEEQGVIQEDLNPWNLMWDEDGNLKYIDLEFIKI